MYFLSGGGDIDLCHSSQATDGSQCQWCTASDNLIEVGVCVTLAQIKSADKLGLNCPTVRDNVKSTNEDDIEEKDPKQEMTQVLLENNLPDISCFRAAWIADNAEDACNTSMANDGTSCVWCQTKGDTMGACVSSQEAGLANGQFGLTCPSENEEEDVKDNIEDEEGGESDEEDSADEESYSEDEDILDAA